MLERLEAANKRAKSNTKEWDDYLLYLAILPEFICKAYQFIPGTPDEKKSLRSWEWHYSVLAQWMGYLAGNKPLDPDLFFTPQKLKLKPRAEISKAVLDLAIELLPRRAELQEVFQRPVDMWFAWEVQSCEEVLLDSGLITGCPGSGSTSKDSFRKIMCEHADLLADAENYKPELSSDSDSESATAFELLISSSVAEARDNKHFLYSKAFTNYQRKVRAWGRAVRIEGDFGDSLLQDGKFLPTGRNAQRSKNKGFVTKSLPKKT